MLPHLAREKSKKLRFKKLRRDAAALRAASAALQDPAPPPVNLALSLTRQKAQARQTEREVKKAEHKLSWMDRLWGLGRGPIRLRVKWLERLGL